MVKGVFSGSGIGLQSIVIFDEIIRLTGKPCMKDIQLLYLGTATYDAEDAKQRQLIRFIEAGVTIHELQCANTPVISTCKNVVALFNSIDIILVSGGNTLYAVDTWRTNGLLPLMIHAASQGVVCCGGSAGAICWFDGGHSDSTDPTTYRVPQSEQDSSINTWKYVRVPCLGILPGLVCPHADRTQSNGLHRTTDFNEMMLRHAGERGICIDHYAALAIDGDQYKIIHAEGQVGSHKSDGTICSDGSGSVHTYVAIYICLTHLNIYILIGLPGVSIKDNINGVILSYSNQLYLS
jgi:dipeptidase E